MSLYNRVFYLLVFIGVGLNAADSISELVNNQEHFEKQKEIFENLEQKKDTVLKRYDIQKPELLEVKDEECFVIKSIRKMGLAPFSLYAIRHIEYFKLVYRYGIPGFAQY
jgi:hypothetical protein